MTDARTNRIDPLHPDALRLIDGSEAEQSALYPAHLRSAFSPEQLVQDDIRFYIARRDGAALACGGYGAYDGYGELKRVFVDPAHRGTGLADAIIAACEADAAAEGLPLMRLETGEASPAALRIYTRHGYTRRGPFGSYEENGSSVFMEKPLPPAANPASESALIETAPQSPKARALLEQSHALMNSLFPKGACHYLDIDALAQPHITLWLTADGQACGALARMDGYGEVKSLFTDPAARGKGHADRLLTHIIAAAMTEGLPLLRLETGTGLDAAHRLYARHGFTTRGPFGTYEDSPHSIFMERPLSAS